MIPIGSTGTQIHRLERSRSEITDPADADELLEDMYGVRLRLSRKQTVQREGPLLTHSRTSVGPFAIDEVYAAGRLEAAPDPLHKVVAIWATGGRVSGECDGMASEATAGDIAILSQPDLPHRAVAQDVRVTSVLLEPALVAGVATGLPGGQAPLPLRFTHFGPVDAAAARLWKDTVRYVKQSVLSDDTMATPLVLGHAGRLLATITLSTFPNTAAQSPAPCDRTDHQPVLLRRAMEFMDANAANDIGLADIAEAVHVTPRAVQYMFRRHLDTTPLQYLRRLRLHYAHQDLMASDRLHTTVADIAARWGFVHTGRFAVMYRETYGQSPHTTLRGGLSPGAPGNEPTSRAEIARVRATELRERRDELERRVPTSDQTVEQAQRRVDEALHRAERAHHAAADRHGEAGLAHRRAAAAHEQAAMVADGESAESHQDAAEQHRDEAQRHDAAAAEHRQMEEDDAARQTWLFTAGLPSAAARPSRNRVSGKPCT